MNARETYRFYRIAYLHFTTKQFDCFKTKSVMGANKTFDNLSENEKLLYKNISEMKEPKTFIIGNLMFNENNQHIKLFHDEPYLKYRKFLRGGEHYFKEDLKQLEKPLKNNFVGDIPPIIQMLIGDEISLLTVCAFEKMIPFIDKCDEFFLGNLINKVKKSTPFFKIDVERFKRIVIAVNKPIIGKTT